MKVITFPAREWSGIKERFSDGLPVYSVRVSEERGKYDEGERLLTEWGEEIVVSERKKISGGLEGLRSEYAYFDELDEPMLAELADHDEMDILTLRKT